MSPTDALNAARAAGVEILLDGDDLLLEASSKPPAAVLDALSQHKAEVVALLRFPRDDWSADDWLAFFNERAGIAEFDGDMPRREAEVHAFVCCIVEWLNRNPVRSSPDRCLGCEQAALAQDPLLPFGTESTDYAWLHLRCWPAWHLRRRAEAASALAAMGIASAKSPNDFGKIGGS